MNLTSKADILVFFANAIDTMGEDGSRIYGCTIHYVFLNTMVSAQSEYDITKSVGMQRGKSWVDYNMRDKVRIAPAIYEGTFEMAVGSDGKPVLKLTDIAYKSHVQFVPYVLPGLEVPGMIPCDAPDSASVRAALETLKSPAEPQKNEAAAENAEPSKNDAKADKAEPPKNEKADKKAV